MVALMRKLVSFMALLAALPLAGCEPPPQPLLDGCRKVAGQRASDHSLTANDMGELLEACMAERGFLLHKNDESCAHNLDSQSQRRCYYPDTLWGRLHRMVTAD